MKFGESIYLDYQASSPLSPAVYSSMEPYLKESPGNPHSTTHSVGWTAASVLKTAQDQIATSIGADRDEIIFTSGATESNNLAILGIAQGTAANSREKILVGATEHKCVLQAADQGSAALGSKPELLTVDSTGTVDLANLQDALKENVLLVSVMAVNNEVGTINNIHAIAEIVRGAGAFFHCDAAQAPTAIDISNLAEIADLVSLSAHKMYGPQGIGALFIRRDVQRAMKPIIYGGGQQNGLRSGTVPVALAVGMGKALEMCSSEHSALDIQNVRKLRDQFTNAILQKVPGSKLNGPPLEHRHPGNANIYFPKINAEDFLLSLQPRLAASTGSACTTGIPEPSHVLRAMGLTAQEADSSIRFSIGKYVTQEMIDESIRIIDTGFNNWMQNSPVN